MLDSALAVLLGATITHQKVFGKRNYVSFIQYTITDLTITKPVAGGMPAADCDYKDKEEREKEKERRKGKRETFTAETALL